MSGLFLIVDWRGVGPLASALQKRRSTTELPALGRYKLSRLFLQLLYLGISCHQ